MFIQLIMFDEEVNGKLLIKLFSLFDTFRSGSDTVEPNCEPSSENIIIIRSTSQNLDIKLCFFFK